MTTRTGRTVRLRRLGAELRRLREGAELTQDGAAELTGVDRSSVIAIEGGRRRPQRRTLLTLLEKYGASEEQTAQLLALIATSTEPAWMRPLRGRLPDAYEAYIDLESDAQEIKWYGPLLIPGLLQTERYARAHTRDSLPDSKQEEIDARVTARVKRQAAFTERAAPLSVVMTEAAIRYEVGGTDVRREQLAHLLTAAEEPHVTIQVIPFSGGAHPSMTASFRILDFPHGDPSVVCQESAGGDLFLEDPDDLRAYRWIYSDLQAIALPAADTRRLITHEINEIERLEARTVTPELHWRKSSYSGENGDCVEIADLPGGGVAIRDSKDPDGPALIFKPSEWDAFVRGVKGGEFDQ
jgi:transcriptional regulator with XRE-family HTH domain